MRRLNMTEEAEIDFGAMFKSLEGEVVLPVPRVSREVNPHDCVFILI